MKKQKIYVTINVVMKMENMKQFRRMLMYEKTFLQNSIDKLDQQLRNYEDIQGTIIIKKIKGRLYYYRQWTEEGRLRSKSLGPVGPGSVAEEEKKLLQKKELEEQRREKLELLTQLEQSLKRVDHQLEKEALLEDYTFEVYWKDEISARVYVRGKEVKVARFIEHPVHQLFAREKMSRHQLNRILESRCWDRGRPDIQELLEYRGLKHYRPLDIVRKTHGVSYNDYLWFRFPGEKLTSKDVLVR